MEKNDKLLRELKFINSDLQKARTTIDDLINERKFYNNKIYKKKQETLKVSLLHIHLLHLKDVKSQLEIVKNNFDTC
jgi:flagellar biosynthesis chaperone FliJ